MKIANMSGEIVKPVIAELLKQYTKDYNNQLTPTVLEQEITVDKTSQSTPTCSSVMNSPFTSRKSSTVSSGYSSPKSPKVTLEGFLKKREQVGPFKLWKKYFFCLTKENKMYIYKDKMAQLNEQVLGCIPLGKAEIVPYNSISFGFIIRHKNHKWHFAADCEESRNRWINTCQSIASKTGSITKTYSSLNGEEVYKKEGFLEKQTKYGTWKAYHFVVKDGVLTIYNPKDYLNVIEVALQGSKVFLTNSDSELRTFKIVTSEKKKLCLRADSSEEAQDWVRTLSSQIKEVDASYATFGGLSLM